MHSASKISAVRGSPQPMRIGFLVHFKDERCFSTRKVIVFEDLRYFSEFFGIKETISWCSPTGKISPSWMGNPWHEYSYDPSIMALGSNDCSNIVDAFISIEVSCSYKVTRINYLSLTNDWGNNVYTIVYIQMIKYSLNKWSTQHPSNFPPISDI
jgi:hypothetical protein